MADKPFIRVRSKATGHEYDIHEQAFSDDRHELVEGVSRSATARPPKPVQPKPESATEGDPEQTATPTAENEPAQTAALAEAPTAPTLAPRKSKPAAEAVSAGE